MKAIRGYELEVQAESLARQLMENHRTFVSLQRRGKMEDAESIKHIAFTLTDQFDDIEIKATVGGNSRALHPRVTFKINGKRASREKAIAHARSR